MEFNDLLSLHEIDQTQVALCLHKPSDAVKRRRLQVWAEERPDLFEAYQSTHGGRAEATVRNRPIFASFIAADDGAAVFLGLYERQVGERWTAAQFLEDPVFRDLISREVSLGKPIQAHAARLDGRIRFAMSPNPQLSEFSKRLVVRDPGGRTYMRRADTTGLEVLEVKRMARVAPDLPSWDDFVLTARDLHDLPRDWQLALRQWRGIYLIVDQHDGARYVGAAYGEENLLGRWRAHVAREAGVTAELRRRRTDGFRFSILELLSPTASADEVIDRERSWMKRLDTIERGLNS